MPINDVFLRTRWAIVISGSILYPGIWSSKGVSGRDLSVWQTCLPLPAPHKAKAQANSTRKVIKCGLKSVTFGKANTCLSEGQRNTRSSSGIWAGDESDGKKLIIKMGFLLLKYVHTFLCPVVSLEESGKGHVNRARAVIPSGVTSLWDVKLQ